MIRNEKPAIKSIQTVFGPIDDKSIFYKLTLFSTTVSSSVDSASTPKLSGLSNEVHSFRQQIHQSTHSIRHFSCSTSPLRKLIIMKIPFTSNQVTFSLFSVYLIALYWIIVLKFNLTAYHDRVERAINMIPFREAVLFQSPIDWNDTLLNILIFIPFGLYVGLLWEKWSIVRKIALFFSASLVLETSQYTLVVGAFDITDLINNTLGGILGLLIMMMLERTFQSRAKAQRLVNIICMVGTVLIFSLLIYMKINNIWIFRMQLLEI
jgi:glycopeptide antibiotics resistance protein